MNTEFEEFFELRPIEKQSPLTTYQKAKQFVWEILSTNFETGSWTQGLNRVCLVHKISETLIKELNDVPIEPKERNSVADNIYDEGYDHHRISMNVVI